MSDIETLICRREMSLIRSTSFGFCTKYNTLFSKYRIEQMPQKVWRTRQRTFLRMVGEYEPDACLNNWLRQISCERSLMK